MFLWKNAVVLAGLLAIATLPATMLIRAGWERAYFLRLMACGVLVSWFAVCALPMLGTQIMFMLLMIGCFDRRVPMAGTYFFFFFWAPAAGSLLAIAGAYIAPLTPFLSFSGALLFGYMLHPESHARRRMVMSDVYMIAFALIYCVCVSVKEPPTGIARNVATYFIPYMLTYFTLSRLRMTRPELVLRLMVFGAGAAGLLCIFETVRSWPLYAGIMGVKNDMWTIDAPRSWIERGGIARAYGPYAHPLTGGTMLAFAAIGAWGLWLMRGKAKFVPIAALAAAIMLGLAATLSRSGLIAIAVGIMMLQALRGRYLLAVLVPLAGLVVVFGLPILGGADAQFSTTYRMGLITGVPAALGSKVWFGYRAAVTEGLLDAFIQGEGIVDLVNSYIALIVQGGIASLVPYVLFLFSAFPHYRAIRRMDPSPHQLLLAQTLISIHGATIVALGLLSSWAAPMQLSFVLVAMMVALRTEVKNHPGGVAKPAPAEPPPSEAGYMLPMLR